MTATERPAGAGTIAAMLTARQEEVLRRVVELQRDTGVPVGSKTLAADPGLGCGPSTVRSELACLEEHGLLAHPHTSAGRVPTDAGRRYYVDRLLPESLPEVKLEMPLVRREVDEAMRLASAALSELTNLMAVITAPPLEAATVHRVEALLLQDSVVMVVVITSAGGVTRRLVNFPSPVDRGLVEWAGEYLNERLAGHELGLRSLLARIADPSLGDTEREFVDALAPALGDLGSDPAAGLYVEGAGRLLGADRLEDLSEINELISALERRVSLLGVLRKAQGERDVLVRIGSENELPALRSLSLVAASFGPRTQGMGTVSLVGPVRMDYAGAIATVREAAWQLSRYADDVYEA